MAESLKMSVILPVPAGRLYRAWLSGAEHSAFTGSKATVTAGVGVAFTAGDDYIQGTTLELEPNKRIVQSWRTTEFAASDQDSRLEVLLEETSQGTKVTLVHTNIPDGQAATYRQGWLDFYFMPMKQYFAPSPKAAKGK